MMWCVPAFREVEILSKSQKCPKNHHAQRCPLNSNNFDVMVWYGMMIPLLRLLNECNLNYRFDWSRTNGIISKPVWFIFEGKWQQDKKWNAHTPKNLKIIIENEFIWSGRCAWLCNDKLFFWGCIFYYKSFIIKITMSTKFIVGNPWDTNRNAFFELKIVTIETGDTRHNTATTTANITFVDGRHWLHWNAMQWGYFVFLSYSQFFIDLPLINWSIPSRYCHLIGLWMLAVSYPLILCTAASDNRSASCSLFYLLRKNLNVQAK